MPVLDKTTAGDLATRAARALARCGADLTTLPGRARRAVRSPVDGKYLLGLELTDPASRPPS